MRRPRQSSWIGFETRQLITGEQLGRLFKDDLFEVTLEGMVQAHPDWGIDDIEDVTIQTIHPYEYLTENTSALDEFTLEVLDDEDILWDYNL